MTDAVVIDRPDWGIAGVNAGFTRRSGGVSEPPYDRLNLALHVGDDADRVTENRRRLVEAAGLAAAPRWLAQVHGTRVMHIDHVTPDVTQADAVWSDRPGQPCAVLVADCLPILIADRQSRCVAAVHAGWRGLAGGVIANTVHALPVPPTALMACIGPAIGTAAFQVGAEVLMAFRAAGIEPIHVGRPGDWRVDLRGTARHLLQRAGVAMVTAVGGCTATAPADYFSYRRDGVTGRLAGFVAASDPG